MNKPSNPAPALVKSSQGDAADVRCEPLYAPPTQSIGGLVVMTHDEFWRMVAEATARGVAAAVADMQKREEAAPALEKMLTAEQCAELAGVDLTTWRRLERRGQVPRGIRLGPKVVRWCPAVMADWMRTGVVPVPAPAPLPIQQTTRHTKAETVFEKARKESR